MELRAVKAAEEGRMDEALQLLTEVVTNAPDYASGYNNRAQVAITKVCTYISPSL